MQKYFFMRRQMIVLGLMLFFSVLTLAADDALRDQARFLQSEFSPLADAQWQKVLLTNGRDAEALCWLAGNAHLRADDATAQRYRQRLNDIDTARRYQKILQQLMAFEPVDTTHINKARKVAKKSPEKALPLYRRSFHEQPPVAHFAREYYDVMAAIPAQLSEAIKGLKGLVKQYPEQPAYRLSAAKAMSQKKSSRRKAIAMLEQTQSYTHLHKEAQIAWAQALVWHGPDPQDKPLYSRYLAKDPGNKAVRKRWQQSNKPIPDAQLSHYDRELKSAYQLLEQKQLEAADTAFDALLKQRPSSANALGGKGLVAMQQQTFKTAVSFLQRAVDSSADNTERKRWKKPLTETRYWQWMQGAEQQMQEQDWQAAKSSLHSAEQYQQDLPLWLRMSASCEAGLQNWPQVEAFAFAAWQALANYDAALLMHQALLKQQRFIEAQQWLAIIKRDFPEQQTAYPSLQALFYQAWGHADLSQAQLDVSVKQLQQTINEQPENAWPGLSLLLQGQDVDQQLAALQQKRGDQASLALALWYEQKAEIDTAQRLAEEVTAEAYRDIKTALLRRLQMQLALADIDRLIRDGQHKAGETQLQRVAQEYDDVASLPQGLFTRYIAVQNYTAAQQWLARMEPKDTLYRLMQIDSMLAQQQTRNAAIKLQQLVLPTSPSLQNYYGQLHDRLQLQQAIAARKKGQKGLALNLLQQLLRRYPDHEQALSELAILYQANGEYQAALDIYRIQLDQHGDSNNLVSATWAAIQLEDYVLADDLSLQALPLFPDQMDVHEQAGLIDWQRSYHRSALTHFYQGLFVAEAANSKAEEKQHYQDYQQWLSDESSPLRVVSASNTEQHYTGLVASDHSAISVDQIQQNRLKGYIDEIERLRTSQYQGGIALRWKDGDAGLSQLTELELPLTGDWAFGENSRMGLTITPVWLDAGKVMQQDRLYFGQNALQPAFMPTQQQDDQGIAVAFQWHNEQARLRLGTTPIGFMHENIVALAALALNDNFTLQISRRAVTDSLLSYAGATDELSGINWGAAMATGVRANAAFLQQGEGLYLGMAADHIAGENLQDNSHVLFNGGYRFTLQREAHHFSTTGIHLQLESYQHNASGFSFGHGGYFSPKTYLVLSLPFVFSGSGDDLSYDVGVDIGGQYVKYSEADWFAGHTQLQQQLEGMGGTTPRYAASEDTSVLMAFSATLEKHFRQQFSVGLALSYANTLDYDEATFQLYFRYQAKKRQPSEIVRIQPLSPFYRDGL